MKKFPTHTPKRRTRLLSSLSIGALLVTGLVVGPGQFDTPAVYASGGNCPTGVAGGGTSTSPCLIATVDDLVALRVRVDETGGGAWSTGKHFKQDSNLDLVSVGQWVPIGNSSNPFNGNYDGGGFAIRNLTIDEPNSDYQGLFGNAGSGTIKNVRLEGVNIRGNRLVGGIAGRTTGSVQNSSVTGTVRGSREFVGGLVGQGSNASLNNFLVFNGTVEGGIVADDTGTTSVGIGGIVGRASGSTNVSKVYVRGTVKGNYAGGIMGSSSTANSTLELSYASVEIGTTRVGQEKGGALIGRVQSSGDVIKDSVFWNTDLESDAYGLETSGFTDNANGLEEEDMVGAAAAEAGNMKALFDGDDEWQTVTIPVPDFPVFKWQIGEEIEVTVTARRPIEGGTEVVPGALVTFRSNDQFIGDVETTSGFPVDILRTVHDRVTASAVVDGRRLVASAVGPWNEGDHIVLDLDVANLPVVSGASSTDVDVSDATVDEVNLRTFTAAGPDAELGFDLVRNGLLVGDVLLDASGVIDITHWESFGLNQNRTLTIRADENLQTATPLAITTTGSGTLTLVLEAKGEGDAAGNINIQGTSALRFGEVTAAGTIRLTATSGNLLLTDTVTSGSDGADALVIGAGIARTDKDHDGGDIIFELPEGLGVNQALVRPANGSTQLFTGDIDDSFRQFSATERNFSTLFTEAPPPEGIPPGSTLLFVRGPERPNTPEITIIARSGQVDVVITAPDNSAETGVTGYQYSLDDGDNWEDFDPPLTNFSGTETRTISGTDGEEVNILVRVLSANGNTVTETQTVTPGNPALSTLTSSVSGLAALFDDQPNLPQYALVVPTATTDITVTPTAEVSDASITVDGETVVSGVESQEIPLVIGQNTITIQSQVNDAIQTITLLVTRQAPPAPPTQQTSPRPPRPQVEEPLPGVFTIPSGPTRPTTPPTPPPTPTATGPTLVGGQPPVPSPRPEALIGGVPTPVTSTAVGQTGVRLSAGTLDLGVRVNTPDQGTVGTTPEGEPELSVVKGQQTLISGSGVAPGSTVQAFLPLAGNNAVELGRIQADATGTFNGAAVLNTPATQAPLPVGRQVLQILGVDEGGNQTVINMTINIAQPPPQPEINRENQEVPVLGVGQSLATEAGLPVAVRVIPVPENKQTLIEGDGWTMGVSVAGEGADVTDTGDGNVRLTLVRNETAEVSGSGFMPFTRADVWLFSDPTLLGTVDIDENGEFNGVVNVDGNVVAVGEHTLQLQGVGEDGYVRAANLGVVVGENPDLVPSPTATTSLAWLLWVAGGVAVLVAISVLWWWRRRLSTVA